MGAAARRTETRLRRAGGARGWTEAGSKLSRRRVRARGDAHSKRSDLR